MSVPSQTYQQVNSEIPMGSYVSPPQQPVVFHNPNRLNVWTRDPQLAVCRRCGVEVLTNVVFKSGAWTWLGCLGMAMVGCVYGCCLAPFCIDEAKDVIHVCPNCTQPIGVKKRINFS